MGYGFKILVEGEYALFTRPEFKVERVSYDVPTVSAMEGLIKSIYWKPAIRIVIDKIVVFHPIRFINIRRNEVSQKVPLASVKKQMNGTGTVEVLTSQIRSQRASMLLRDVKYGVEFHFEMTGLQSQHPDESPEKHYNIMLRRLRNGQHFRQPCLGCREFAVRRLELVDVFDLSQVDLGVMLYGLRFRDGGTPVNQDWDAPQFSDAADPMYYRPHMIDGVIDVAKYREGILC